MPRWKYVISLALIIYCIGCVFFALYPFDDVKWGEWIVVLSAGFATILLLAYITPGVRLPGEQYAFLITGYAGFTTLLLYLTDTTDPTQRRTGIALFLLSGAVSGYGAFLGQDRIEGQ